jgi:hypothetical protein
MFVLQWSGLHPLFLFLYSIAATPRLPPTSAPPLTGSVYFSLPVTCMKLISVIAFLGFPMMFMYFFPSLPFCVMSAHLSCMYVGQLRMKCCGVSEWWPHAGHFELSALLNLNRYSLSRKCPVRS